MRSAALCHSFKEHIMNNNSDDDADCAARSAAVRKLNDALRTTLTGTVLMTAGVVALGPDKQAEILAAIRAFDAFDADPWAEHDFGAIEVAGERVYFKLDLTRAFASREPADPSVTERVLTIMLASEY